MHAFLLEFGISTLKGAALIKDLAEIVETNEFLPYLENLLQTLREHYDYLLEQIKNLEPELKSLLNEGFIGQC